MLLMKICSTTMGNAQKMLLRVAVRVKLFRDHDAKYSHMINYLQRSSQTLRNIETERAAKPGLDLCK